jgi:thiol-disulfide isomerase/thioredoxin
MRTALLALALTFVAASPNESLLDLPVHGASGGTRTLRELAGDRPTVVALWATYCPPCKMEVPVLNRAAERWTDRGVHVLGVVVDSDDPQEIHDVVESWGIEYPIVWPSADERQHVATLLPRGLPTTFFIGNGRVRRHEGVLDDAGIDRMIKPLLPEAAQPKLGPPPAAEPSHDDGDDCGASLTVAPAPW